MKELLYQEINQKVDAILSGEDDLVCAMANFTAIINAELSDLNWVGFYQVKQNQLVLGPFQGLVACTRIAIGKGVCGNAVLQNKTLRVDDVHQFEGHIACDSASNSEIVIPVRHSGKVIAVLDIDSPVFSRFDKEDQQGLEALVHTFERHLYPK